MKISDRPTLSILALAIVSPVGPIGLADLQLKLQSAAAGRITGIAIAAELNSVHDSLKVIPGAVRNRVLTREGINFEQALDDSLEAQRAHPAQAEQARAQEFHVNDRRSAVLPVFTLFNAFAAALGGISLYETCRENRRRSPP